MADRWTMNRIGFVNFWLYDEENFTFQDGKLMLRGQNGSGKSIATQSIIPFILDGDRTPSRLDPFGSSDRKMDYYFLGEDERDDSTGYMFLELYREDSGQYRTLVIGQRARRGKAMNFWGAVILDNRRIGYDISLYREVGSSRIPLDKQELRKLLGENTPFTDEPGKYKDMVNRNIFGFSKMEQYEQFIRLLIKVRAPKLSKEFRPTKVYEILNESLQTLTDADMRPMVDAMEKMDQIQESLEGLGRACRDTEAIRTEYTRYNQFFLGKKAERYLTGREQRVRLQQEAERQKKEMQKLRRKEQEALEEQEQLAEELSRITAELEGLLSADSKLEELEQKIRTLREEQQETAEKQERYQRRIQESKARILECDREIRALEGRKDETEEKLEQGCQEQEEIQENLQWEGHSSAAAFLKQGTGDYASITGRIRQYQRQLQEAKARVQEHTDAEKRYGEALQEYEKLRTEEEMQQYKTKETEKQKTAAKERLITEMYAGQKQNREWILRDEILHRLEEKLQNYEGASQGGEIQTILLTEYNVLREKRRDHRAELLRKQQEVLNAGQELEMELQMVRNLQDLEPERSGEAVRNRERLEREGIPAVPFYKCLEFAEGLRAEESAVVENALRDAGLLDALVIPCAHQEQARRILPEYADNMIRMPEAFPEIPEGENGFSLLMPAADLDDDVREEVCRILSGIRVNIRKERQGEAINPEKPVGAESQRQNPNGCLQSSDYCLQISTEGAYRQGILDGYASKSGEAQFVGRLARQQSREKKIAELNAEIGKNRQLREELREQLGEAEEILRTLQREYENRIQFGELDRILDQQQIEQLKLEHLRQQVQQAEVRLAGKENEKNRAYQAMLSFCRPLPYERTVKTYAEAICDAEDYLTVWQRLYEYHNRLRQLREQLNSEQDKLEREEQQEEDDRYELRGVEQKLTGYRVQLDKLEEILKSPELAECARQIEELRSREKQDTDRQTKLGQDIAACQTEQRLLAGNSEKAAGQLAAAREREKILEEYFREELQLGLLFRQENRDLCDCAREAAEMVRTGDQNRSGEQLTGTLYTTFYKYSGSLSSFGATLESCFETENGDGEDLRGRKRIYFMWTGRKLYLEEFYQALKLAIEETELLIRQKDRELFEDILSQTISAQLTERIAESRKWVKDMSALMRKMDTSMGLHFSLEWKPLNSDGEEQLDTGRLEALLLRDKELLTEEDIDRVARHFRSKISEGKQAALEAGQSVNYMDLVREVLDYRKWFAFQMYYYRENDGRKALTNAAFNRFSGGEKAMAMYDPLFAAVNAQYQKAEKADHPRMIALDEAFAGVDDKNISSMFELIEKMDFDYILNSQTVWGCYDTVKKLGISELHRPKNSSVVTVIHYIWNGHERILADQ